MRFRILSASILMLAACAPDDSTPSPSASAKPSTSIVVGMPVAACIVGEWTTTEASAQAVTTTGSAFITGGKGIRVKIGPNGQTDIDFTTMEPVTFASSADGMSAKGQFTYGGKATGHVKTTSTGTAAGVWEPIGTVNWADVTITVDLIEPLKLRVVDKAQVSDYTGDKTGGAVQIDPLLGKSAYSCGTGTLTLVPAGGMGLSWQLVSALGTPPPATMSPR